MVFNFRTLRYPLSCAYETLQWHHAQAVSLEKTPLTATLSTELSTYTSPLPPSPAQPPVSSPPFLHSHFLSPHTRGPLSQLASCCLIRCHDLPLDVHDLRLEPIYHHAVGLLQRIILHGVQRRVRRCQFLAELFDFCRRRSGRRGGGFRGALRTAVEAARVKEAFCVEVAGEEVVVEAADGEVLVEGAFVEVGFVEVTDLKVAEAEGGRWAVDVVGGGEGGEGEERQNDGGGELHCGGVDVDRMSRS